MAIQFDNTNTGVATISPGTSTGAITLGGSSNTASGSSAAVVGGSGNTANNDNAAILGGSGNVASGLRAIVIGGQNHLASGSTAAVIGGVGSTANSSRSIVIGGVAGSARSIAGNFVYPSSDNPIAFSEGVQQLATLLLGRQTTDATATRLTSNTSAAGTTNQVILPNNSAYFFRGEVIAGVTGAGNSKGWTVEGVIKRGANAASTVLVGTPTVTSSYADAGASAWTITATADTTNGGLAITVTGQAATTIRWVAQIRTTEMTF
jgi:hypothetical protein